MNKKVITYCLMGILLGSFLLSKDVAAYAGNTSRSPGGYYFDETTGDYLYVTPGRYKANDSSGYLYVSNSSGHTFMATMVAADSDGGTTYYDDFTLKSYTVREYFSYEMINYINENGYNYAAMSCESTYSAPYNISFLWAPDLQ